MNRAFAASLSDLSSNLPMVLIVAAVALFVVALLVVLVRSSRTFAIGTFVVIALLAAGFAATLLTREPAGHQLASLAASMDVPVVPALACLDELAGDVVETACERAVFASAETTAAAVSYTAAQISRLESYGDVAAANKVMTPSLRALRRAVERDRFGMVAHVLATRDECTLSKCGFFVSLTNTAQIANNMNERVYDGLVAKHAPVWGQSLAPVAGVVPPIEPERPTGKPVSGDFPSSASIPPISIMAPEPATSSVPTKPAEPAHAAPKAAAKKPAPSHPRSLTPPAAAAPSAPAAAPASENNR